MKFPVLLQLIGSVGPSPHGEGGLKFTEKFTEQQLREVSLPPRGGWIEIAGRMIRVQIFPSLPPRGGWIEISMYLASAELEYVPPPTGRVD